MRVQMKGECEYELGVRVKVRVQMRGGVKLS